MIIGTTPTFTLKLKKTCSIDLTQMNHVYATLKQGNTILTKQDNNLIIVDSKTVQLALTQQESLGFALDKSVEIQLNWTYTDSGITKRGATKVMNINLEKQLLKQVLT